MKAKKCRALMLMLFLELALSCDKSLAIEQRRFHSEVNGYSFTLPKGWIQIPEDVVHERYSEVLSNRTRSVVLYEAEFQLEADDMWFQLPTILIQVAKYSDLGLSRPLREDQFGHFIRSFTGRDVMEVKDELFGKDVSDAISGYRVGKVSIDKTNRSYTFVSEVIIDDASKIKSEVVGYFGKQAVVQLVFNHYAEADWSRFSSDRNLIFSSFEFDPIMAYRTPARRQPFWEKLLVDVGVYGILALVVVLVGLLAGIFKSKLRREPKDENTFEKGEDKIEKDDK